MEQGVEPDFYAYTKKGVIEGAVCTDNGWLANDNNNPANRLKWMYFPRYSILLPFNKNIKCFLPFKTKSLSTECRQFYNSSFSLFSGVMWPFQRSVCFFFQNQSHPKKRSVNLWLMAGHLKMSARPDRIFI